MPRHERRSRREPIIEESDLEPVPRSSSRRNGGNGIGGGSLTTQVALFVVIIASVGAIFAYSGNVAQINSGLYKAEAAQRRSEAATHSSDFHARRTDQALAELARDLAPQERKAALQARADAFKEEKDSVLAKADKLETEATAWDNQSKDQLIKQHRWIEAVIALQLALMLAAIALIARKAWLEYVMIVVGLVGIALGAVASLY